MTNRARNQLVKCGSCMRYVTTRWWSIKACATKGTMAIVVNSVRWSCVVLLLDVSAVSVRGRRLMIVACLDCGGGVSVARSSRDEVFAFLYSFRVVVTQICDTDRNYFRVNQLFYSYRNDKHTNVHNLFNLIRQLVVGILGITKDLLLLDFIFFNYILNYRIYQK